jgi:hypothetical protein
MERSTTFGVHGDNPNFDRMLDEMQLNFMRGVYLEIPGRPSFLKLRLSLDTVNVRMLQACYQTRQPTPTQTGEVAATAVGDGVALVALQINGLHLRSSEVARVTAHNPAGYANEVSREEKKRQHVLTKLHVRDASAQLVVPSTTFDVSLGLPASRRIHHFPFTLAACQESPQAHVFKTVLAQVRVEDIAIRAKLNVMAEPEPMGHHISQHESVPSKPDVRLLDLNFKTRKMHCRGTPASFSAALGASDQWEACLASLSRKSEKLESQQEQDRQMCVAYLMHSLEDNSEVQRGLVQDDLRQDRNWMLLMHFRRALIAKLQSRRPHEGPWEELLQKRMIRAVQGSAGQEAPSYRTPNWYAEGTAAESGPKPGAGKGGAPRRASKQPQNESSPRAKNAHEDGVRALAFLLGQTSSALFVSRDTNVEISLQVSEVIALAVPPSPRKSYPQTTFVSDHELFPGYAEFEASFLPWSRDSAFLIDNIGAQCILSLRERPHANKQMDARCILRLAAVHSQTTPALAHVATAIRNGLDARYIAASFEQIT